MANDFSAFTNKYALSKTLRFELKPVGKTLENMCSHLGYDKELQTFLKDQQIEDAYQQLKPVLDSLHEAFITESLSSETAKTIDFTKYWELYQQKKEVDEKELVKVEKELRQSFDKAYTEAAEVFQRRAGDMFEKTGPELLAEKTVFDYIRNNTTQFTHIISEQALNDALDTFQGFSVYFSGFHQNRLNYYATKDEAATAVATRVIHENLPKYCDNMLVFTPRAQEYVDTYSYLERLGRDLVTKEGIRLMPIDAYWFSAIEGFTRCLTQTEIVAYNDRVANANALINLYNQARKEEKGFTRLPLMKKLYKQIGCFSDKKELFFEITKEREDDEGRGNSVEGVLQAVHIATRKYFMGMGADDVVDTVPDLFAYLLHREDYMGVYISKLAMNSLSSRYFGDWQTLKELLKEKKVFQKGAKDSDETIKIPDAIELEGLFTVLASVPNWRETMFKKGLFEDEKRGAGRMAIVRDAKHPGEVLLRFIEQDIRECIDEVQKMTPVMLALEGYRTQEGKELIKKWMDDILRVTQILKYFSVKQSKAKGLDSIVSEALDKILLKNEAVSWFGWYDALRNYLTKKPQDDIKKNKIKLNFENAILGDGWDVNKEPEKFCALFEDGIGHRFLGIITKTSDKGYNKILERTDKNPLFQQSSSEWKKIEYRLLPGPNKMLPKCLLPASNRKKYGATDEILRIYEEGSFKKGESFSRTDLKKLIDFYKEGILRYEGWSCFHFSFQPSENYEGIDQFYLDVEKQGYKLDKVVIDKVVLDRYIDEGKMYLFEIKNQDANEGKLDGHKQNLHTMYWSAVFGDSENKPKLNGGIEIFYRRALYEKDIKKKLDKSGKEVIESPRFSKPKFLFHVPITLNPSAKEYALNDLVQKEVGADANTMFLGIDRGEKHLAYYSLVDKEGRMHEQGTLNIAFKDAGGSPRKVLTEKRTLDKDGKESIEKVECADYNDLLEARAGDRAYARKNWQTINSIADLKNGYVSQVVKQIAEIAIKHRAFIVLEDLGRDFNRGRQKIEKSVYQKLELALAQKLNFYVDKSAPIGSVGSVTRALQLTPPVANYQDIENRNQVGIMLYTRADYTSQTDPSTGWRKSIYLKRGSEDGVKKQIADKFKDIFFDGKDFVFAYDQVDKDGNKLNQWAMYSGKDGVSLDRYHREKDGSLGQWTPKKQDIHAMLERIFERVDKNRSIYTQIIDEGVELQKISSHTAWESLRFAIELIQQIRNTGEEDSERDDDFLQSPVRREDGTHFDSRIATVLEPSCGDANGAYNIARKGIMMNECLQMGVSPRISDFEWDMWLKNKEEWRVWAKTNKLAKKTKTKSA